MKDKVILITGAARRIGAAIARCLHARGAQVMLHYHRSKDEALTLASELNAMRAHSAALYQADLFNEAALAPLLSDCLSQFGRLDGLVNNASRFFASEIGKIDHSHWNELMDSNVKAPLFLSQAAVPHLAKTHGAIVGILDIHAKRPLKRHIVYNVAKAAHAQLIRSLALELAPQIRVNGVAPGTNIWPEKEVFSSKERAQIEASIPLQRIGQPEDIAYAVAFLLSDEARYMTGQILAVDGGRSVGL